MQTDDIKISVIVPIYKVEEYIYRSMQSCREQALDGLEFICVDDGSPDRSGEIAEEYASIDSRFRVIHKENGGLSSARNAGMKAARGKYLMFLDSDDYLCLNACEAVWNKAEETKADIICFGAYTTPAIPEADTWHDYVLSPKNAVYDRFEPDIIFNRVGAKPFVWRQAFRREFVEKTEMAFDETVKYGEDIIFEVEAFPQAEKFAFMSDRLYNYRWFRNGSLMNMAHENENRRAELHLAVVDRVCRYWQVKKVNGATLMEQYGPALLSWILDYIVADYMRRELDGLEEHKAALRDIFAKYGLEKFYAKLPWYDKKLWKATESTDR